MYTFMQGLLARYRRNDDRGCRENRQTDRVRSFEPIVIITGRRRKSKRNGRLSE